MALRYLNGKSWAEVTRDERFFCSHLAKQIEHRGIADFVRFVNGSTGANLDPDANWEIGFEVCFYRDLWHIRGKAGKLFSPKRTFDLCLFSDDAIMIIEAKAQQAFDDLQVESFESDKEQVKQETGVGAVHMMGLASSLCPVSESARKCFGSFYFTWKDLAEFYQADPVLQRADKVYEQPVVEYGRNNVSGKLSGLKLIEAHHEGADFFVGRAGGLNGDKLTGDIASGRWETQLYETNRNVSEPPNENWFKLGEFARRVSADTLMESIRPVRREL